MVKTLAIAVAPLVSVWTVVTAFAWCTSSEHREALGVRRRDLGVPTPDGAHPSGIVDLSRYAAAYSVAIRVGGLVRFASFLLVVTCALFISPQILSLAGLAVAIWIVNRSHRAAGLAFFAAVGDATAAFNDGAWAYHFPRHKRGMVRNLLRRAPGTYVSILGLGLIGGSGLPFAYGSDTLVTGIPGLTLRDSHLPLWLIGAMMFTAGTMLALFGAWVTRGTQRREMRAETRIDPRRFGKPPAAVFLRPFDSELLTVPSHPGPRREAGPLVFLPKPRDFLENVVTWLFWADGEVLAIGQPDAGRTKTVGAAHHPLRPNADWQAAVRKLLERTKSIIVVPGQSAGIAWEIDTVLSDPDLARKSLIVNPHPRDHSADFLATIGTPDRAEDLARSDLRPLAAFFTPTGPTLLCSSLSEDLDYEMAVEWFLRHHPAKSPSLWHRAQSLAVKLGFVNNSVRQP